jgi:MOSC domain-containing protein YiiM
MTHRTLDELARGLDMVRAAPVDEGLVRLIVRRTGPGQREVLDTGELDVERGLAGDDWIARPAKGSDQPSPWSQVTVMNARFAELIAGDPGPHSWAQAGDQLYLDLDISVENLPAGTWLEVGGAIIEIQPQPHTGCVLFSGRFGSDALRMTASEEGRALRLRGANTIVVRSGSVRTGDPVRKVAAPVRDSGSSTMGVARAG